MPIPPTIFDSDDTQFVPVRGMETGAHALSRGDDRKSCAPQLDDGAETQHVYISRLVVPFIQDYALSDYFDASDRPTLKEWCFSVRLNRDMRTWFYTGEHTGLLLHDGGGEIAEFDRAAASGSVPFHGEHNAR